MPYQFSTKHGNITVYEKSGKGRYQIFSRTWWKENPDWPNGLEPCPGKCRTFGYVETYSDAQAVCQHLNSTTKFTKKQVRLSYKYEFTSEY